MSRLREKFKKISGLKYTQINFTIYRIKRNSQYKNFISQNIWVYISQN